MTIKEILDLWIEKGAQYFGADPIESIEWDNHRDRRKIFYMGNWHPGISLNDILYGDSNFWEVILPCPNHSVCSECGLYGCLKKKKKVKNYDYWKMQSTLHKDKIAFISNLLEGHPTS